MPIWNYADPRQRDLINQRFNTADQFAIWVKRLNQTQQGHNEEIAANGALVFLSVACALLDRQIRAQAEAFQKEGGFTERLYRTRLESKKFQSS